MTVPYAFGAATSAIPLSQLDSNFNTPITLGNTAIQLGNTVTTLNNMTLANVTISSGNVTITNVTVTTANATTVNTTTLIATTANVTTGNVTSLISGNVTLTGGSITGTPISGSTGSFTTLTTSGTVTLNGGVANGVAYLDGSKVLTTGSALTFNGTSLSAPNFFAPNDGWVGWDTSFRTRLVGNSSSNFLATIVDNTEQMRLTSTGLGIGTSSPVSKLQSVSAVSALTSNAGFSSLPITVSDSTALAADTGGGINFNAIITAGGAYNSIAAIKAGRSIATGFDYRGYLSFYTGSNATGYPVENMRLDASGNLGIGTSSPSKPLEVYNTTEATVWARTTTGYSLLRAGGTGGDFYFGIDNSTGAGFGQGNYSRVIYSTGAYPIVFSTNAAERMRLDSSGNLGLGVTPSAWATVVPAFQIGGAGGYIAAQGTAEVLRVGSNNYYNAGWKYVVNGYASRYDQASGAHAWYTAGSGTAGNAITFTQAMTLDASGNLGVGTTSPTAGYRLHLAGSSGLVRLQRDDAYIQFANTANTDTAYIQQTTSVFNIVSQVNGAMVFGTNSTERARIDSSGNLLVGTTDAGATTGVGVKTVVSATIPAVFTVFNTAGGGNAYNFYNTNATNNGYRFYVKVDGGIANYQANDLNLSDVRKKTDIQPAGSYLDKICSIPVKTFLYKDQSDTARNLGVIAQDVDAVAPELVDRDGFGETPEGESPYLSIYQTDLQYALMKALQELKAEFDAYKATHP